MLIQQIRFGRSLGIRLTFRRDQSYSRLAMSMVDSNFYSGKGKGNIYYVCLEFTVKMTYLYSSRILVLNIFLILLVIIKNNQISNGICEYNTHAVTRGFRFDLYVPNF